MIKAGGFPFKFLDLNSSLHKRWTSLFSLRKTDVTANLVSSYRRGVSAISQV
jgi:hypothetical protein